MLPPGGSSFCDEAARAPDLEQQSQWFWPRLHLCKRPGTEFKNLLDEIHKVYEVAFPAPFELLFVKSFLEPLLWGKAPFLPF